MGPFLSTADRELRDSYRSLIGKEYPQKYEVEIDGYVYFYTVPSFGEFAAMAEALKNMVRRLAVQKKEQRQTTKVALRHMPSYPPARDVGGCRGRDFKYHRKRPKIHN